MPPCADTRKMQGNAKATVPEPQLRVYLPSGAAMLQGDGRERKREEAIERERDRRCHGERARTRDRAEM